MEQYLDRTKDFNSALSLHRSKIIQIIDNNSIVSNKTSLTIICSIKQELLTNFEEFEKVYTEYRAYLNPIRSKQSNTELETIALDDTILRDKVFSFLQTLEEFY